MFRGITESCVNQHPQVFTVRAAWFLIKRPFLNLWDDLHQSWMLKEGPNHWKSTKPNPRILKRRLQGFKELSSLMAFFSCLQVPLGILELPILSAWPAQPSWDFARNLGWLLHPTDVSRYFCALRLTIQHSQQLWELLNLLDVEMCRFYSMTLKVTKERVYFGNTREVFVGCSQFEQKLLSQCKPVTSSCWQALGRQKHPLGRTDEIPWEFHVHQQKQAGRGWALGLQSGALSVKLSKRPSVPQDLSNPSSPSTAEHSKSEDIQLKGVAEIRGLI